jgi:hypothetical protein
MTVINETTKGGRPFSAEETVEQIGKWNVFAVSGGRVIRIINKAGETISIILPINGTRCVEVALHWDDTYVVRRLRKVVKGQRRGENIIESEVDNVYCDEVGEAVYQASCWK